MRASAARPDFAGAAFFIFPKRSRTSPTAMPGSRLRNPMASTAASSPPTRPGSAWPGRRSATKARSIRRATAERSRVESEIRALVASLIAEIGVPLSVSERDAILGDVIDEVFGFGPLEPLLRDKTVSDILVNTYKQVFVERAGKLEQVPAVADAAGAAGTGN